MLDRVRRAKRLDGIVVAVPASPPNDVLASFCVSYGIPCFRGPEDDVLGRMLAALEAEHADIGVEVYGDGFLIDPAIIDSCVETFLATDAYDFVGNDLVLTFPSGQFVEAFSVRTLKDSAARTSDPSIREHGTLYIRQHPELYRQKNIEATGTLRRPDIHLDIDTEHDLKMTEAIVDHFAPRNDFSIEDVIGFLDAHPDIRELNRHVYRRWRQYQRQPV